MSVCYIYLHWLYRCNVKKFNKSQICCVITLKRDDITDSESGYLFCMMTIIRKEAESRRRTLLKKATSSEKAFSRILDGLNIKYEPQKILYNNHHYFIVDFFLTDENLVVEIDGGYHNTRDVKNKDKYRTNIIMKNGIDQVIRFTNEQVECSDYAEKRIKSILGLC